MINDEEVNLSGAYIQSRRPTRLSLELLARVQKKKLLPTEDKTHESAQHKSEKSELK